MTTKACLAFFPIRKRLVLQAQPWRRQFGPKEVVKKRPSLAGAGVSDYEGNGLNDYVLQNGSLNGYFEMDDLGEWQPFRAFTDIPNIDWNDPNMRFMDLDGDGVQDILMTENDCFVWYPSKAKEGFDPARRVPRRWMKNKARAWCFRKPFKQFSWQT
ncbi:MAG: VCBS repeat-containing protein [Lewinellaceae bacterium]|nr:VCBS repeat-containing protein [Lewinellaceae bacterium]